MLQLRPQTSSDRKEQDRLYGENLFVAGQDDTHCTNIDQRRGYYQALRDSAYAETNEYLVRTGRAR